MAVVCAFLLILTLSFALGAVHHDRQTFHFQLFNSTNNTPGLRHLVPQQRSVSSPQFVASFLRKPENPKTDDGESDYAVARAQLPAFDPGNVDQVDYEDDYELLKAEYDEKKRPFANTTEAPPSRPRDRCFWPFCGHWTRKFTLIVIAVVVFIIFWCYSGLICYYLPCGWVSGSKVHSKIRDLLDKNKPGYLVDDQGNLIRYEPCDEEVAEYRKLQEDLQDL